MNRYFEWHDSSYVERYQKIYAFEADEIQNYLSLLNLQKEDHFVDFGCGDGKILREAGIQVTHAFGIDPSLPQLKKAQAHTQNNSNITLIHSDFLNCDLAPLKINKAASRKALHHLPNLQKEAFFEKLSRHLPPHGLFLLEDAMTVGNLKNLFSIDAPLYYRERWEAIRDDFIKTFEEEYPATRNFLIRALQHAGFEILKLEQRNNFYGRLLTRRPGGRRYR